MNGDILISRANTRELVGAPVMVHGDYPHLLLSDKLLKLVPDESAVDARYLVRALRSPSASAHFFQCAGGSSGSMTNITQSDIRSAPIYLPPLEEQRRIAAILDQAETLRTQRRTALALLDSLTQSLFLDMFGDPLDNTKRWEWRCMSELFETPPIFGTMIPGAAEKGSWLCLRVANIQDWQLTLEDKKYVELTGSAVERHSVKAGDLLMARAIASQEHLGKCVVTQPKDELWAFDSHLMRLRFRADRALPEFIRQMLRTPGGRNVFLKASRKSSVQYNINTKEISALEVPVPPLSLQQTFATRIASIEALKATHRRALAALDALFASLQQRAFRGELASTSAEKTAVARHSAQNFAGLLQLEASIGQEALIYLANRIPGGDLYKTHKALYFADRHHLEHHGRLIYNETYCALPHGPVPQAAYDATRVLNGERLLSDFDDDALRCALRRQGNTLTALRDADFSKLSPKALESLEWAIRYCRDMTFTQTKTASHDSAYDRTPENEPIPLKYIIETLSPEARQRHWNL
ncbi:restriction endonuclease subunit S [Acidovorax sp. SDU_ACID1]|uniref:restriction endonuclease subunit S n=1 Tax=Acidovorax sp. SDU_ACID1 TaxID=3136632 RepID=UPI00387371D5